MTFAGTVPEHHSTDTELPMSKYYIGRWGEIEQAKLLDMISYFVGDRQSRGLSVGHTTVGFTVERAEDGLNTWNILLPPFSRGTSESSSHRAILAITKLAEKDTEERDQAVFADRTLAAYCLARGEARMASYEEMRPSDFDELSIIEDFLVDFLLEGRRAPVVPQPEVS